MTRQTVVLTTAAALLAGAAYAGGKPSGATPTDPQKIYRLFAGKTSNWDSGGHAYWGPDGTYRGIGETGVGVGSGKWYVTTASKMCHESTWHWAEDGRRKSKSGKWCWEFATAPDGTIFERFLTKNTDWVPHRRDKQVRGDTQARRHKAISRQLGL
ncbi:DUF995 domain-containing protein [Roseovarius salinarum]|uniref:DUF995 domain-containing protein n=1 Tax=Roseovarius salinarum TaxID=1981892 RepID=UPI000C324F55|nr:DUF995 domain-containing protein [Roseovarius salinarum]